MRYLPDSDQISSMDAGHITGSIVTLGNLDDVVAETDCCHREESYDKVRGPQQKLYHDTFVQFCFLAYSQLVGSIRYFAQDWCTGEFEPSPLSHYQYMSRFDGSLCREAILEVYVPSLGTHE